MSDRIGMRIEDGTLIPNRYQGRCARCGAKVKAGEGVYDGRVSHKGGECKKTLTLRKWEAAQVDSAYRAALGKAWTDRGLEIPRLLPMTASHPMYLEVLIRINHSFVACVRWRPGAEAATANVGTSGGAWAGEATIALPKHPDAACLVTAEAFREAQIAYECALADTIVNFRLTWGKV